MVTLLECMMSKLSKASRKKQERRTISDCDVELGVRLQETCMPLNAQSRNGKQHAAATPRHAEPSTLVL